MTASVLALLHLIFMTTWLKWRLCALFVTSLFIGGATYLHAQSDYPAPAKTPEAAALSFFQLLKGIHDNSVSLGVVDPAPPPLFNSAVDEDGNSPITTVELSDGSISRVQFESFQTSHQQLKKLMESLYKKANETQYDAHVAGTNTSQTLVEVTPALPLHPHMVVVIAEDGGYRVDLKATFARWNNLSGDKLDEEWFRYTGALPSASGRSNMFLKLQCQSLMKEQMLGIIQYTLDYDGIYPPARKWMDVVAPYTSSKQIYTCPVLKKDRYGYAYNQYLSKIMVDKLASPATTINVYETSNPNRNWFGPGTGRAYRHSGGWNLAFADSHGKWYPKGAPQGMQFKPLITTLPPPMPGTPYQGMPLGAP
ncbi:hypothetical protein IAD21_05183 [Abditibacteriota bacterium]|nr:hypothetical protein IAD21_05183 [Abditibacteriota bacterium]